jgi:hypothetical protein
MDEMFYFYSLNKSFTFIPWKKKSWNNQHLDIEKVLRAAYNFKQE